ncbi:hypothetical protein MPDQ_001130 [Monascus purpureus]|uniref:Uncharacterized protein n=1 Tax=Monascus purpureus TaxID=5098 RepID=A0A507QSD5_MONPU|nr:hypothetical protein MPDQ_001130 [Monascus purpureus]BDD60537.1 hypothetical protein MAP00_005660 [Monascus purpureus]
MADEITQELQQLLHNIPGSQSNTFPPLDATVSLNNDEDAQSSYDSDTTTSVDDEDDEVVNDDGQLPLSMGLSRSMIQDFEVVISSNGQA